MRFYQVDAFTENPFEGNPCAVFPEAEGLSDGQMLAIAREMNLSETAFLFASEKAQVKARYFTPAEEIPLAGHPTIASLFVMLREGTVELPKDGAPLEISMELTAGTVTVRARERGGRLWISMRQLPPRFGRIYTPAEAAPAFALSPSDFLTDAPVQTVSTGTPQLMVPVKNESALRKATLVRGEYHALKRRGDFSSPHIFVIYVDGETVSTSARHFGGATESSEDPFTGSATGGMGAYLYKHRLMPGTEFTALQGASVGRPGIAACTVLPDDSYPEGISGVEVTGTASFVFSGELAAIPERRE